MFTMTKNINTITTSNKQISIPTSEHIMHNTNYEQYNKYQQDTLKI